MGSLRFISCECTGLFQNGSAVKFFCNARALDGANLISITGEGPSPDKAWENARQKAGAIAKHLGAGSAAASGTPAHQEPPAQASLMADHGYSAIGGTAASERKDGDKSGANGGGNKPISEKQISAINKLSRIIGSSGDRLATELFAAPLASLKGYQAQAIFDEIQKRRGN